MVDRDPLDRWSFGRVTLLGDAAHPMYPIGSNGSSQAILDARVLAREIKRAGAVPNALQAYEAERRPATTTLVLANRGNGPDHIMELVEQRAPDGYTDIQAVSVRDGTARHRRWLQADRRVRQGRPKYKSVNRLNYSQADCAACERPIALV